MLGKLPLSGHRAHGLSCCRIGPVAIDPELTSAEFYCARRPKPRGQTRHVFPARNAMRSEVIVAGGLCLACR